MSSYIDNKTDSINTKESENLENINELKQPPTEQLLGLSISLILEELINQNRNLNIYPKKVYDQSKMVFSCHKKPKISLLDYINRIIKYTYLEKSTLIISLIYLDRICQNDILLTDYNIHRLLFISIIISIKMNEDTVYANDYYAQVAGVPLKELNNIESEFLVLNNFNFFVSEEEYLKYKIYLEKGCKNLKKP